MKKVKMFSSVFAILFAVAAALVTYASPRSTAEVDISDNIGGCSTDLVCDTNASGTCDELVGYFTVEDDCLTPFDSEGEIID